MTSKPKACRHVAQEVDARFPFSRGFSFVGSRCGQFLFLRIFVSGLEQNTECDFNIKLRFRKRQLALADNVSIYISLRKTMTSILTLNNRSCFKMKFAEVNDVCLNAIFQIRSHLSRSKNNEDHSFRALFFSVTVCSPSPRAGEVIWKSEILLFLLVEQP